MKVIITAEIAIWCPPEEAAEMDDAQIIELLQEDIPSLLDDATWRIVRDTEDRR